MQLRFDDATEAFRAELCEWLDAHAPDPGPDAPQPRSSADLPEWAREWQRQLYAAGYLVPAWSPEYGGRNASPVQTMVYMEEMGRRELPRSFNPQGLSIITPSILDYGTEEQKQRFAVPTLKAQITWSLGMSEPGAGSDLAALKTRAEVHEDHFVVSGQKVWTSGAHHSDWNFCFVRTDP
jgi:alkylation response protein AidB-like acyl-CoA dehydrogenase